MSGKSRIEKILENLLGENNVIEPPIGRDEKILYSILNDLEYTEPPHSIFEELLLAIKNGSPLETEYAYEYLTRDEKILFCKLNRLEYFEPPHSRLERLLIKWLYLDLYLNIDGIPPFTFISNGSPIIDYAIYGNTLPNGTPTPDSPVMPQGTGERTGNLAKYWKAAYVTASGAVNANRVNGVSFPVKLEAGQTVSFTNQKTNFGRGIAIFSEFDGETLTNMIYRSTNNTVTYTADSDCYVIIWGNYDNTTSMDEAVFNLCCQMLNSGSTALPFEPYGYKIQISSANTTTPVYLGEVETTRKIKKHEFTGQETAAIAGVITATDAYQFREVLTNYKRERFMCSHMPVNGDSTSAQTHCYIGQQPTLCFDKTMGLDTTDKVKTYLAQQYAAGTPVTVWYVLAEPETAVVNEPLMKIGDYADSISYEQTVVSIPTVSGRNTFDVLGDVKPSNVEITYAPRAPLLGKRKTILKK